MYSFVRVDVAIALPLDTGGIGQRLKIAVTERRLGILKSHSLDRILGIFETPGSCLFLVHFSLSGATTQPGLV